MAAEAPGGAGGVEMKRTLSLTGVTVNAMALIAPGAFLWLTFAPQAATGATAPSMWIGILFALVLCLATAVCYAELSTLYPGPGISYSFAEQSFLNHDKAWRYARLSKFIVGWASHLYYWIYPGVMVGVMGILCGYLVGTLWPGIMNSSNPGTAFMMLVAIVFSFVVGWIAYRGVNGSTAVNIAINVVQISALVLFSADSDPARSAPRRRPVIPRSTRTPPASFAAFARRSRSRSRSVIRGRMGLGKTPTTIPARASFSTVTSRRSGRGARGSSMRASSASMPSSATLAAASWLVMTGVESVVDIRSPERTSR